MVTRCADATTAPVPQSTPRHAGKLPAYPLRTAIDALIWSPLTGQVAAAGLGVFGRASKRFVFSTNESAKGWSPAHRWIRNHEKARAPEAEILGSSQSRM